MRVCGVEIQGSEAVISLLALDKGLFELPECRTRKFLLKEDDNQVLFKKFQFDFAKLIEDYKIEKVVIKSRPQKGKFAGGAVGFKIEAAIQLINNVQVEFINGNAIKEQIKRNPIAIDFSATGLKKFQEAAFAAAYANMNQTLYAAKEA